MYQEQENCFYYITMYNENYGMPPMPEGVQEGSLKGLYRFRRAESVAERPTVQLLGSGPILREALRAQQILAERFQVAADVWSATSFNLLRREALEADRWNRLHPQEPPRRPHLNTLLDAAPGPIIAATDYLKIVPDQIAPWLAGRLHSLGTDGFGRSDTRTYLRRFFEVDAESIALAALYQLSLSGEIPKAVVSKAVSALGIDPEKAGPTIF
jgi:pyruvate dehydrogenase E1 component